jgi:hypothetical protein
MPISLHGAGSKIGHNYIDHSFIPCLPTVHPGEVEAAELIIDIYVILITAE